MSRYVGDMCQSRDCSRPKEREENEEIESKVKIYNKINIIQKGIANANGGKGGDGGDNNSAAAAPDDGVAVAVSADVEVKRITDDLVGPARASKDAAGVDAAGIPKKPSGEEETEAEAGNGGDGGDGGTATVTQSLEADIYNITVVFSGIDADVEVETDGLRKKKS